MASATDLETIAYLRSPRAIRERCRQLFDLACANQLRYFGCDLSQLDAVADYVIAITRAAYPDLAIPFHSRWRHFEGGDVPRLTKLASQLAELSPLDRACSEFDLTITSVLLDAGAGADWRYQEPGTDRFYSRSEGLAVASFYLFCQGGFSSHPAHPLQADAIALQQFSAAQLAEAFQVNPSNRLVGLAGRAALLQQLGKTLYRYPHLFGSDNPRPGHLVHYLKNQASAGELPAGKVLDAVLAGFSDIWPGRVTFAGVNLGDVWHHPALAADAPLLDSAALVPFHKLSQWLTYSLLEPLQKLGLTITGLDQLTGLPEYRNGGLCLDLGLLTVKDPIVTHQSHSPGSEVIVEWRALTVILLDQIAETIRPKLGMDAIDLPLAKVLQGGTWTAGRQIAATRRKGGVPPIQIISDGTVF